MKTRFAAVLAATLCALTGCEDKKTPGETGKGGTSGTLDAMKEKATDAVQMAKDGVLNAANKQIDKANGYIEQLKAQASKIAADAKPEYDKAVAEIEAGLASLKTKIEEMKKAGAMEWQSIGGEVTDLASKLYNDAKAAVEKWVK